MWSLFEFSLTLCQRATIVTPNHYNMTNASQGNSHNARNSQNKQTDSTVTQTMHLKFPENVTKCAEAV